MTSEAECGASAAGRLTRLARSTLARHLALAVAAGAALFAVSMALGPFDDLRLATMAYYFVALAGLVVLTGASGQISLGHGALMAIGAYATVKLLAGPGWPLAAALAAATAVTAAAGVLAGAAAARLRGPYLAGATLALAVGLPALAERFPDFLGGDNGLTVAPPVPPAALGEGFPLERWQAWIACLAALIAYVLLANLTRGRFGRALRAVHDDEIAAQLAGLRVARIRVLAFTVSAACAGLAGGLLVVVTQLVAPGAFGLSLSIALLTGVVLGGLGSLLGAVWGAAALVLIPSWSDDVSRALSLGTGVQANLALAIYGLALIVLMLAAPGGLHAGLTRLAAAAGRFPQAITRLIRGIRPQEEDRTT